MCRTIALVSKTFFFFFYTEDLTLMLANAKWQANSFARAKSLASSPASAN